MGKYNFNRAMGDTIRQVALGQKQKYTPAECIESMLRNIEIKIVVRFHISAPYKIILFILLFNYRRVSPVAADCADLP